nr:hypothetical protein CFP56_01112 [Quercus suber]
MPRQARGTFRRVHIVGLEAHCSTFPIALLRISLSDAFCFSNVVLHDAYSRVDDERFALGSDQAHARGELGNGIISNSQVHYLYETKDERLESPQLGDSYLSIWTAIAYSSWTSPSYLLVCKNVDTVDSPRAAAIRGSDYDTRRQTSTLQEQQT